jgi:hypothetical protein
LAAVQLGRFRMRETLIRVLGTNNKQQSIIA